MVEEYLRGYPLPLKFIEQVGMLQNEVYDKVTEREYDKALNILDELKEIIKKEKLEKLEQEVT